MDSLKVVSTTIDTSIIKVELQLAALGKKVLHDSLLINRQNANHELSILLEKTLAKENAYYYPFDSLVTISKLRSNNDSFRVFTWQFFENDDTYFYMGYILKSDGTLIKLNDTSADYFTPEFESGDKDHWYGALYYNMVSFQSEDAKTLYLLFGRDENSLMERRKLIDVLSFDEEGNPTFGAAVFVPGEESTTHPASLSRIVLEYYAEASVRCNYDEIQNQILFEHLIFKKTDLGEFLIPDGSYEGYVYSEGQWKHNAKVFHQISDSPPFPNPILDKKENKKDIFGNDYKRATVNPNRSTEANKEIRKRNKKLREEKKKQQAEGKND